MTTEGQLFGPHSDLSYQVIEDVSLDGTDLRQCLFTGAVFRRTIFRNVNFRRSDFDAARFEGCTFESCDLSIDMRSTLFIRTSFATCTVGTAFITDCSFDSCRFEEIHFDDCAITQNEFERCSFAGASLTQSTFVHNTVRRSQFLRTSMGDCTFLYVIMTDCEFLECTMNLESVGMIYGLSEDAVDAFQYIHLGVQQDVPARGVFIQTLFEQYEQRRWRIGVAVLRLNFRLAATLNVIHEYLVATDEAFTSGIPLNREELLFVAKLLTQLGGESRLPLGACFEVSYWCAVAAHKAQDAAMADADRTVEVLRELSSRSYELTQTGLRAIESSESGKLLAEGVDAPTVAVITFTERPSADVSLLINTLCVDSGLHVCEHSHRLDARAGSWTEIIQTTTVSLAAFRIFLYFLNGILYDLAEARARLGLMLRVRPPKEILDVALHPKAPVSTALIAPLKAIANEVLHSSLIRDPHLGGLDATNVQTIRTRGGSEKSTNDVAQQ